MSDEAINERLPKRVQASISMHAQYWRKLRERAQNNKRLPGAEVEAMLDEALADGDDAAAS